MRLIYGGTPADFVIAQGAAADVVDDEGAATEDQGAAVLLPLEAVSFTAYTDAGLSSSTTDLLDEGGTPMESVSQSTEFDTRGTIPRFQGPDGHEGPLWLSADGVTGYRLEPESDTLYTRVGEVEGAVTSLELDHLINVDAEGKADGDSLRWNNSTGQWEPSSPAGTGTVTSVAGVSPDSGGNVPLTAASLAAATAADMATVKANVKIVLKQTGSGYPSKAGFTYAEFQGIATPVTGVVDGDTWLQPASDA